LLAALAAAGAALGGGADGAGAGAETAFGGIAGPTEPVLIDVIANLLAYESWYAATKPNQLRWAFAGFG
ncbi:MAG: hypothetical protein NWS82_07575, partial [Burkholderiaceae bacterium]|nr:hypothetical protein [Burkholderiaceae bacterium]